MVSRLAVAAALLVLAGPVPTAGSVSNGGFVVGFDDDLPKRSGAAAVTAPRMSDTRSPTTFPPC